MDGTNGTGDRAVSPDPEEGGQGGHDGRPGAPLIRCDAAPLPSGAAARFLAAPDGARLRVVRYPLAAGRTQRGSVLVVPGWSEFAEKYCEVAGDLHARGLDVMVCDPRGQGYSQRLDGDDRRGHIDDFRVFVSDLTACYAHARQVMDGPFFLLAHSMGGLITLEWLAEGHGRDLAGAALSAPFTNLYASPLRTMVVKAVLGAGRLLGRGERPIPGVREHSWQFDGNVLTQDARRHERFRQLQLTAPDAVAGLPRYDWLAAALAAHERLKRPGALAGVPFPVLLASATRDETVDHTDHERLARDYPDAIRLVTIEGARHEILMEADGWRSQFWDAFDQYIDERLSPVPAPESSASSSAPRT